MNNENPFVKPTLLPPDYARVDLAPSVQGFARTAKPVEEAQPEYHNAVAVEGVTLNNFKTREPIKNGKYVLITTHNERLEKIKQPEEIEAEKAERKEQEEKAEKQRKKENRIAAVVLGAIGIGFTALMVVASKTEQPEVRVGSNGKMKDLVHTDGH